MIVCNCHNIDHREIEQAIKKYRCLSVEEVSKKTCAGTDCGICLKTVEELLLSLGNTHHKNNNKTKFSSSNFWEQT